MHRQNIPSFHHKEHYYSLLIVAEKRMSYFVAGLTNDNPEITAPVYKQYRHVQYNEIVPVSATASVSFPPYDDTFRYVIIQQKFEAEQAICLTEVKVFLRGKPTCYITQMHYCFIGGFSAIENNVLPAFCCERWYISISRIN